MCAFCGHLRVTAPLVARLAHEFGSVPPVVVLACENIQFFDCLLVQVVEITHLPEVILLHLADSVSQRLLFAECNRTVKIHFNGFKFAKQSQRPFYEATTLLELWSLFMLLSELVDAHAAAGTAIALLVQA